jgi:hypothetical protein
MLYIIFFRCAGMVEGSYCTMFGTGLVVSWIYLRFYQVTSELTYFNVCEEKAQLRFASTVCPPSFIPCIQRMRIVSFRERAQAKSVKRFT